MKPLITIFIYFLTFLSFSQKISIIGYESTYISLPGRTDHKTVLKSDNRFEISEPVNVVYGFDLILKTITYNINGIITTKPFTSINYNKKTKIVIITYNDDGVGKKGNVVIIPVSVELNLNKDSERMLMSWYNKESNITIVQDTKGSFTIK
jgi:hypothetical protein